MALTHSEVGAIVSGVVLVVVFLIWFFVHPVRRFTFPLSTIRDEENQRFSASSYRLSGISPFETIGNLTISPGRRPLPLALDIVNHVGMAFSLPAGAKLVRLKGAPRVSVHLPPITPMTPTTKVNIVMAEAGAKAESLHIGGDTMRNTTISHQASFVRRGTAAQERKIKGQAKGTSRRGEPTPAMEKHDFDLSLETCSDEPLGEIDNVFVIGHDDDGEPEDVHFADNEITHGFGSGKSMAALYHAV